MSHAALLPTLRRRRQIHYQRISLHTHSTRLAAIRTFHHRRAGLDRHLELACAHGRGITPRLPGADVELPAVPGAAQKLLMSRQTVMPRPFRLYERHDHALAKRTAGVRAALGERQ